MRFVIALFLFIHSALHLVGTKAPDKSNPATNKRWLWLAACFMLASSALLQLGNNKYWWVIAIPGIVVSQLCIIIQWQKAKAGTIVNLVLLVIASVSYAQWHFYHQFKNDVASAHEQNTGTDLVTEDDIKALPEPVQRYIRYTGAVGKPVVSSFYVVMNGKLRKNNASPWMEFRSQQFNCITNPARLFFLDAEMKHMPVAGYHKYAAGKASMDIKLYSVIPVQQQSGYKMDQSETVTCFNDICVFAPGALTDKHITWLNTYGNKVEALFTNNNITVRAWLYFNDTGQLVNFISGDRYATTDSNTLVQRSWSTPLSDYRTINGMKLATRAQAIYDYEEGPFIYGTFSVAELKYNNDAPY